MAILHFWALFGQFSGRVAGAERVWGRFLKKNSLRFLQFWIAKMYSGHNSEQFMCGDPHMTPYAAPKNWAPESPKTDVNALNSPGKKR